MRRTSSNRCSETEGANCRQRSRCSANASRLSRLQTSSGVGCPLSSIANPYRQFLTVISVMPFSLMPATVVGGSSTSMSGGSTARNTLKMKLSEVILPNAVVDKEIVSMPLTCARASSSAMSELSRIPRESSLALGMTDLYEGTGNSKVVSTPTTPKRKR